MVVPPASRYPWWVWFLVFALLGVVLSLGGCGPAHVHLKTGKEGSISWQGRYTGNFTVGPDSELVVDFQGRTDLGTLPPPPPEEPAP